jgi:hypothetical protein
VLFGTATKPGIFIGGAAANKQAAQMCLDRGWLEATGTFEGKGKSAKETYRITAAGARHALEESEPVKLLNEATQSLKQLAGLKDKIEATLTIMASVRDRLKPPDLSKLMPAVAPALAVPPLSATDGWLPAALAHLGDYQKAHPYGLCPLPELFAQVARPRGLSIGRFHDGLRQLVGEGRVRLHPFTGAAYTLENEQYALVAGQEIKYYAQRTDST